MTLKEIIQSALSKSQQYETNILEREVVLRQVGEEKVKGSICSLVVDDIKSNTITLLCEEI